MPEAEGGLWKQHFHPSVVLRWEVLGWIVAIIPSVAAILLVFDQYTGANLCFMLTATFLFWKIIHVASLSSDSTWQRSLFVFVLCGIIGVGIVEAVRGVNLWASRHSTEETRKEDLKPVTPLKPSGEWPENPPAGYINFAGLQIINGHLQVMQSNQTDTPLDDVHLSIIKILPNSDSDWDHGTVAWQKEVEIGTCRAKLTATIPAILPVHGEQLIRFHLTILTRLQTYREVIDLRRQPDGKHYKADVSWYASGLQPSYTEHETLEVVHIDFKADAGKPMKVAEVHFNVTDLASLTDAQRTALKHDLSAMAGNDVRLVSIGSSARINTAQQAIMDIFHGWNIETDSIGILSGGNLPDGFYLTSANVGSDLTKAVFSVFQRYGVSLPLVPDAFLGPVSAGKPRGVVIVVH